MNHDVCFQDEIPCSSGCPAYPIHAGNLVSHKAPENNHDPVPSTIDLDIPPLPSSPDAPQATSSTHNIKPIDGSGQLSTINHPPHYTQGVFEVIDVIEDWGFTEDYFLGNALKYIGRAKHKGKFTEDLKKAIWYLERRIKNGEKSNG